MRDLQAILFVGNPGPERLEALLDSFRDDDMLTVLHCATAEFDPTPNKKDNPSTENTFDVELNPIHMVEPPESNPVDNTTPPKSLTALLDALLPDLICLFADAQQHEETLTLCQQLREQTAKARPGLIVQSEASETQRIDYFIQGADDIVSPDLSPAEFRIRLLAHLRRNLDFNANEITSLPGLPLTGKVVHRRLNRGENVALLTLAIDSLDVYQEAYGELPTRQVLRTCAALLGRLAIIPPDFISHSDENHFVLVTQPEKAEKLAALMCRQFEAVAPNFYSESDRKQGYMISVISDQISCRVPLLSLSIGIASTLTQPLRTFPSLFNASRQMCTLAQLQSVSSWQGDRLRLSGVEPSVCIEKSGHTAAKPSILVLEADAALAYLLKMTLDMEGYAVDVVSSTEDARALLAEKATSQPVHLMILDAVLYGEEETGLQLTAELHQQYPQLRIICTSSLHNRQRVLQAGAHLYLPRPFELSILFLWIHRLLPDAPNYYGR
jgi:DNA-binding response OmpR family regulator